MSRFEFLFSFMEDGKRQDCYDVYGSFNTERYERVIVEYDPATGNFHSTCNGLSVDAKTLDDALTDAYLLCLEKEVEAMEEELNI